MDNLYSPFLVEHKNRYITYICDPQYICWSADAAAPLAIAVNFWSYVWNNSCSFCSLCVLWQHASHVNKFCAISEVITCAEFHPTHCNTLAYSSSKGSIRLIDLRQSALCDNHSKMLVIHLMPFTCNILSVCTGGSRGLLLMVGTWGCIRFSILY